MGKCCGSKAGSNEDDSQCINIIYDILTILISIADISTDIIVLISFYIEGRTTFFVISLIILIIAQMTYSVVFIWRYEVMNNEKFYVIVLLFFILLPFGSFVSFIIYFTEDPNARFSKIFADITGWNVKNSLKRNTLSKNQSKMTQWIIKKLSKHIGFIVEAGIEALPQSLLQIIAIVYYKEANYVSIVSIFLSMFSVMTKSLVFSQGIDIKTYIWTWLCITVDFLGIFFTLTWVFYVDDTILYPYFLGYFSIFGQIWFYKVMLSVSPCIFLGASWFIINFLPIIMKDLWTDQGLRWFSKIGWSIFILSGGAIFLSVASAVCFIAIEIFCFSFLALGVYFFCTLRWSGYSDKNVSDKINGMIKFVGKPSIFNRNRDRMLRILAVNHSIDKGIKIYDWQTTKPNIETREYIDKIEKQNGAKGLKEISFTDLRNNCGEQYVRDANIFPGIWYVVKDIKPKSEDYDKCIHCTSTYWETNVEDWVYIIGYWLFFIAFPVFTFCKMLQAIFPYIILGHLLYHNHLMTVDLFQLAMLFTDIGLQFILFILGIFVFRTQYWLWHIYPGRSWIDLNTAMQPNTLLTPINEWYEARIWIPIIQKYLSDIYGEDVSQIIMDYYQNIKIDIITV